MQEVQQNNSSKEVNGIIAKRKTIVATSTAGVSGSLIGLASHGPAGLAVGGIATIALLVLESFGTPGEYANVANIVGPGVRTVKRWAKRRMSRPVPQPKDEQSCVAPRAQPLTTQTEPMETLQPKQEVRDEDDDLESLESILQQDNTALPGRCVFSTTLRTFAPTKDRIFLGYLPGGQAVFVALEDLCHVALGGLTGNGKSTLIRLLVSQLEYVGAKVLILNPHYTSYDIKKREDWTPIERHLYRPPVTDFASIGSTMKWIATVLLRERLVKYRCSEPWGSPLFVVIDELPAIVKHVPEFPGYVSEILREGRKVDVFLVVASQDFQVKTIGPDEGGAIRKNFKTKMYVGGDVTTAKELLDMPARDVPENALGEGVIMMRNKAVKTTSLARVPYVDNEALYTLLGPSTYEPARMPRDDEDDLVGYMMGHHTEDDEERDTETLPVRNTVTSGVRTIRSAAERKQERDLRLRSMSVAGKQTVQVAETPVVEDDKLSPELRRAYAAFENQMSYRDLGPRLGVSKDTAGKWIMRLQDLGYIGKDGMRLM